MNNTDFARPQNIRHNVLEMLFDRLAARIGTQRARPVAQAMRTEVMDSMRFNTSHDLQSATETASLTGTYYKFIFPPPIITRLTDKPIQRS